MYSIISITSTAQHADIFWKPISFPSFQGYFSSLSPGCFLGSFLQVEVYVTRDLRPPPKPTLHGAQLHSSRSITNASPLKATLIDVFRQLTPQNRPHGFPRPPLIHPHLMVAQNHAVNPAQRIRSSAHPRPLEVHKCPPFDPTRDKFQTINANPHSTHPESRRSRGL